jgi:hypothetical protein
MCFQEFIGYTCGHCSLPVLRPCPLTTSLRENPVCANRASKPFLPGSMCPTCQKIMNTRGTLIEEYEHRFMHERGACGCSVEFPGLIRARRIGRHEAIDFEPCDPSQTTTDIPPLFEETSYDGKMTVCVRQPSLFAAEWVADHRSRHESGECSCNADFRSYEDASRSGTRPWEKTLTSTTTYHDVRLDVDSARGDDQSHLASPFSNTDVPSKFRNLGRSKSVTLSFPNAGQVRGGSETCADGQNQLYGSVPTSQADNVDYAEIGCNKQTPVLETRAAGITRPRGAIFAHVPQHLKITGPYLTSIASHSITADTLPVTDYQTYLYQQQEIPIIGLPIGAGPEGVTHVGPYEQCVLRRPPVTSHRRTQSAA